MRLGAQQLEQYQREGYLLVSGLIPDAIIKRANEAMWRLLDADPNDPSTWSFNLPNHRAYDSPELVACYTESFLGAAAELGGEDDGGYRFPTRAYVINQFPQAGPWKWPAPHIDHAIKEHGHRTFPRPFRVATMTYLNGATTRGGATVVWPGGHRRVKVRAETDAERYEFMWALNRELPGMDLGQPVEVVARPGDVLFYQCLCPHAGSLNVQRAPRLGMNAKW